MSDKSSEASDSPERLSDTSRNTSRNTANTAERLSDSSRNMSDTLSDGTRNAFSDALSNDSNALSDDPLLAEARKLTLEKGRVHIDDLQRCFPKASFEELTQAMDAHARMDRARILDWGVWEVP